MWHFAVAHNFLIFSFTLIYFFKRVNQNCGPCGFSKETVAFRSSFSPLSTSVHITVNMNVKRFSQCPWRHQQGQFSKRCPPTTGWSKTVKVMCGSVEERITSLQVDFNIVLSCTEAQWLHDRNCYGPLQATTHMPSVCLTSAQIVFCRNLSLYFVFYLVFICVTFSPTSFPFWPVCFLKANTPPHCLWQRWL